LAAWHGQGISARRRTRLRAAGSHRSAVRGDEGSPGLGVDPPPREALVCCRMGEGDAAWTDLRVALAGADRLGRRGCCVARSRSRWCATVSTRPKDIALKWNPAQKRSAHRDFAHGARTPGGRSWCGGNGMRRRSRHWRRRCGNTAHNNRGTRRLRCTGGWRSRTGVSGENELSAADIATAENIYQQIAPDGQLLHRPEVDRAGD
jgi:hypothetical protein